MKTLNSKHSHSKTVTAVLLICIFIVLIIIGGNLYFIFNQSRTESVSSNFTTKVDFESKSIICGNGSDKHIRTFVKKISGTGDLTGIKFIIQDENGKSYSYVNEDSSSIPVSESAVTRIDVIYSQAKISPFVNIVSIKAFPMFRDDKGKQVFGISSKSPGVCYSSCNDCSVSCDLICSNSTLQ